MKPFTRTIPLMGTNISLYIDGKDAEELAEEAAKMLRHYEQVFSANSEHSQLAMLKRAAASHPIQVDKELYDLIRIGKTHSLHEDSFLNIAIGPLIKLWRIGFREAHVPQDLDIKAVLELLNPEHIQLDDEQQTVHLCKKAWRSTLARLLKVILPIRLWPFSKKRGRLCNGRYGGNVLVHGDSPQGSVTGRLEYRIPFSPGKCSSIC